MRFRAIFFIHLFVVVLLALPTVAQAAAIPFFGPIIPNEPITINGIASNQNVCAAGWGMLITVINNIIAFSITIAIVFVAPLMIAWSGFLFVVNPVNSSGISKAKGILTNTIVGIVIALAGWMIVDAIMVVLYNPSAVSGTTRLGAWSQLIVGSSSGLCIPLAGSLTPAVTPPPGVVVPSVPGRFTFDRGIEAQVPTESATLAALLSCMSGRLPAGVGRISSISDSLITSGQKSFSQCVAGGCQHAANSCHYGGRRALCAGSSYAVDFGDEQNTTALSEAARACGANFVGPEGNHLHVSVGGSCGCN